MYHHSAPWTSSPRLCGRPPGGSCLHITPSPPARLIIVSEEEHKFWGKTKISYAFSLFLQFYTRTNQFKVLLICHFSPSLSQMHDRIKTGLTEPINSSCSFQPTPPTHQLAGALSDLAHNFGMILPPNLVGYIQLWDDLASQLGGIYPSVVRVDLQQVDSHLV